MNFIKRLFIFILLLSLSSFWPPSQIKSARAQASGPTARIVSVDTTEFPLIRFTLLANQPDGGSFTNLSAEDVQVQEDSLPVQPVESLENIDPGVQIIIAYNLGPALSNSTTTGGTRFQAVNNSLAEWVESRSGFPNDDYSLATNTGLQAIRSEDNLEFAETLRNLKPDLGNNQPNLTSLLQSLDLASDPNRDPLMKRVIYYVTPQLNVTNVSALAGLIDRAVQQDVHIFIWLVGPATVESSNPTVVDPLKEMVTRTNGAFFLYSGDGELPDPEAYLKPLRNVYMGSYRSTLNVKGTHRLTLLLSEGSVTASTDPFVFPLAIEPPNLVILNPIFTITREWVESEEADAGLILNPSQAEINYLVEFPDGLLRPIRATRLYENEQLIEEDTQPPFDRFIWDFSQYESSQVVELVLEVEDSLGLVETSIPQVVSITAAPKPLSFWQSLITLQLSTERWIILGSVLTTGIVLVIAIVLAGRRRYFWREQSAARERRTDPLTQPVPVRQVIVRTSSAPSSNYPPVKDQEVRAWLVPLNNQYEALRAKAIPLTRTELIIGRDSRQAGLVITSPAISEVHARLTRDHHGDFWLADNHSTAGTWVNYAPLSTQPTRLRHGDLVHFGKNVYRFELTIPPADREAQLITYNDEI